MMGWTLSRVGVGVGVSRGRKAATSQIQALSKSSHFGGVGMCASRAAFSRSVLAIATMVSATFAAPALGQGFAYGITVYEPPAGLVWNTGPSLAEDGTAIGAGYYVPGTENDVNGVVVRPGGRTLFSVPSRVDDISDNGAFTVEYATRRDADGTTLSLLPGVVQPSTYSSESRISGDGNVIAGTRQDQPDWPTQAFRWTPQTGGQYLGSYRPNALFTDVFGISRDGSTIFGDGQPNVGIVREAWKWTAREGFTILPTLPDARPQASRAYASNSDGSIIVGYDSKPVIGFRPLIWTNGVPSALPVMDGFRTAWATDLSDDGSIIIGTHASSQIGLSDTCAVWTQSGEWLPVLDYIRQQGVSVPEYFDASYTSWEVSADGETFSGYVRDTRTNAGLLVVAVVPSPTGLSLLVLSTALTRRSRGRR